MRCSPFFLCTGMASPLVLQRARAGVAMPSLSSSQLAMFFHVALLQLFLLPITAAACGTTEQRCSRLWKALIWAVNGKPSNY